MAAVAVAVAAVVLLQLLFNSSVLSCIVASSSNSVRIPNMMTAALFSEGLPSGLEPKKAKTSNLKCVQRDT